MTETRMVVLDSHNYTIDLAEVCAARTGWS